MGKGQSFQQGVLGKLDIQMEKDKSWTLTLHNMQKNDNSKRIKDLNL